MLSHKTFTTTISVADSCDIKFRKHSHWHSENSFYICQTFFNVSLAMFHNDRCILELLHTPIRKKKEEKFTYPYKIIRQEVRSRFLIGGTACRPRMPLQDKQIAQNKHIHATKFNAGQFFLFLHHCHGRLFDRQDEYASSQARTLIAGDAVVRQNGRTKSKTRKLLLMAKKMFRDVRIFFERQACQPYQAIMQRKPNYSSFE